MSFDVKSNQCQCQILIRNDIKQNPNKALFSNRTSTSKNSAFVTETCKLNISDQKTKKRGQIDM